MFSEDKFKGSNGWVDNFKKWQNLRQYNIHGEAASAPLDDLDAMRDELRSILKNYDPMTSLIVMKRVYFGR